MEWTFENQKFAIIDIETTGGSSATGKITEIAILIWLNGQIIDRLVSLVNPEQNIPYYISSLTGIDDQMVKNAPKFFELAKSIIEITQECVFVAHNVNFDYGFVKEEFRQLGFDYQRKTLCTVQLSRKIIPGFPSYSLGKLCSQLQINIENRHRALGDAEATALLFNMLTKTDTEIITKALLDKKHRYQHPFIEASVLESIPESSGIYYFKNAEQKIIYIGKSINLKERIYTHLSQTKTKKNLKMLEEIQSVEVFETGSELTALLEESKLIKQHKPKYNRALTRIKNAFGIFHSKDAEGYIHFKVQKINASHTAPLAAFSNIQQAKLTLGNWVVDQALCQKMCGLHDTAGACFYHGIGECNGACIGEEPVNEYNARALQLIKQYSYKQENMLIVDRGRQKSERSVVLIKHSVYQGHTWISEEMLSQIQTLIQIIPQEENNQDVQLIINSYIKKHPELVIIPFDLD